MYIPEPFKRTDPQTLDTFIAQYDFAILVTCDTGKPQASHIPLIHIPNADGSGLVRGHMARANPQWQHMDPNEEVLLIFQGPHAYVSPSWYKSAFNVPTWNYTAVHAYGHPRLIHGHDPLRALLDELVTRHEAYRPDPWSIDWTDARYTALLDHIVGFEITLTRLEGKFKLSQNKPPGDRQGVVDALAASSDATAQSLAQYMRG